VSHICPLVARPQLGQFQVYLTVLELSSPPPSSLTRKLPCSRAQSTWNFSPHWPHFSSTPLFPQNMH